LRQHTATPARSWTLTIATFVVAAGISTVTSVKKWKKTYTEPGRFVDNFILKISS
jgi:hypothetical protein